MNARPIPIVSPDSQQDLRREVTTELVVNVTPAAVAYACRACGAIIAFAGAETTLPEGAVACPACGVGNNFG